jgi:hypothetical protein
MEYFFSPFPKEGVSERILMWLPLTLFFPVGFMYAGLFAFWVSWVLTGDWKNLGYSQNESIVTSGFVTESDNTTDVSDEPQCAGRKQ